MTPEPVRVTLRPIDLELCEQHASAWLDLNPEWGGYIDAGSDRRAACLRAIKSELAIHRALGLPWQCSLRVQRTDEPDVAGRWQVRARAPKYGDRDLLPVRPHDNPRFDYVLVIVGNTESIIKGYLNGHDAKQPEYWHEHPKPSLFWVPQDDLKPFPVSPWAVLS